MNRKTNKISELHQKSYLLCMADSNKATAVMSKERCFRRSKEDPTYTVVECDNVFEAAANLQRHITEDDGIMATSIFHKHTSFSHGKVGITYRQQNNDLHSSEITALDMMLVYQGSPVEITVRNCNARAKCVVRNREYLVCALKDIPVEDIYENDGFLGRLEDPIYRNKYEVTCIAEIYNDIPHLDEYGILYLDFERMYNEGKPID